MDAAFPLAAAPLPVPWRSMSVKRIAAMPQPSISRATSKGRGANIAPINAVEANCMW